jgi:hypothetical protein
MKKANQGKWPTIIFLGFFFIVIPFKCLYDDWSDEHEVHTKLSKMSVAEFLRWQVDESIDTQTDESGHILTTE